MADLSGEVVADSFVWLVRDVMIRTDQLEPAQPRNCRALEHNSWRNIAVTRIDRLTSADACGCCVL